MKKTTG